MGVRKSQSVRIIPSSCPTSRRKTLIAATIQASPRVTRSEEADDRKEEERETQCVSCEEDRAEEDRQNRSAR